MSKKHALIIGINKYSFMENKYQLRGCVNDAKLIKSILINKFNFEPTNIVELYDSNATRDAILAQMDRLANDIGQDDILVFHYSGHGHQCKVKTEFTDEGSGKDNCILPSDDSEPSEDGPIWREIRDHQINEWLRKVARKTRYSTLIFDACHSGTMTRSSAGTATVRSIPTHARPQPATPRSGPVARDPGALTKQSAGGWLTLSDNYVVISGCRDTQTSKEKEFTRDGQTARHGVLTYYLTGALMRATPGTTYRDAFELACSGVVSEIADQNPQIEGAVDREIFGVQDIEPLRYIPVTQVNGDTLVLDGGAAHGLRVGSKWAVYPAGSKQADPKNSLGVLGITEVGALSATGAMVETRGQVKPGARCVEIEMVQGPDLLQVDVTALDAKARAALVAGIDRSPLLALAHTPDSAHIHARIVDSVQSLPGPFPKSAGGTIAEPTWAFVDGDGALCMPLHPVAAPGLGAVLLSNLEKIARFRNVLRLDNPDTGLNVEFNLYRRNSDDERVPANGGNCEFTEEDALVLEISNKEIERTVFFSVLWLSASREIGHFYPHRKASEELSPGKTIRIGDGNNKLTASLGPEYFAKAGTESCKLVFSTRESDFRWLNQDGLRSGNGPDSGIGAFDAAVTGLDSGTGGDSVKDGNENQLPDDWGAITRSFILTRPVSRA